MKQSLNGHTLVSQADELIATNIELKTLLNKRNQQSKFLYLIAISLVILVSAIAINRSFHPQPQQPLTAINHGMDGDISPAHDHHLYKVSKVLKDREHSHVFLYKEMTIKISQAFWDAALIKSNYVMHNYRLRWMAERMPFFPFSLSATRPLYLKQ